MQRKKYLAKNTALFALNSIGTRLITFLLVPIYTKAFEKSVYGVVDFVTTMATIIVPIITLNIGEAVMRFSLDDNADERKIISVGALFTALSAVLGMVIFLILSVYSKITVSSWIVYLYCVTLGFYQTLSCTLRGQEKLFHYAMSNIISTFLSAILNILFLIVFKYGVEGYFMSYIISNVIAGCYCIATGHIISILKKFTIDKLLMKSMVKYAIVLVPNSLMWWIMNSSDHLMVVEMIGLAANGVYAISYKLPSILSALSTVFNQAWSYSAIHENKSDDRNEFNNNMYDNLVRFQLIVTVLLMCIIKPFMRIYVEPAYYDAWKYTPYLLTGNFFLTMATFLSTSYTVNKDNKGFLYSGTVGALVNISLNWLLIPVIRIHGAALATCISYITVFLYRVKDTRKYIIINTFKKEYVIGYLLLIVTAVSMSIKGYLGQIILIIECVVMIIINRKFVKVFIDLGLSVLKIKRKK